MRSVVYGRLYRDGDVERIEATADFQEEFAAAKGRVPPGPAFTVVRIEDGEEQPIAAGGFTEAAPFAWDLWGYAAPLSLREWAVVADGLRRVLWSRAGRHGVVRAAVRANRPEARAFLAHFGFERTAMFENGHLVLDVMSRSTDAPISPPLEVVGKRGRF